MIALLSGILVTAYAHAQTSVAAPRPFNNSGTSDTRRYDLDGDTTPYIGSDPYQNEPYDYSSGNDTYYDEYGGSDSFYDSDLYDNSGSYYDPDPYGNSDSYYDPGPYDSSGYDNAYQYDLDGDVTPYVGADPNAWYPSVSERDMENIREYDQYVRYTYQKFLEARLPEDQEHWWRQYRDAQFDLERFRQNVDFRTGNPYE